MFEPISNEWRRPLTVIFIGFVSPIFFSSNGKSFGGSVLRSLRQYPKHRQAVLCACSHVRNGAALAIKASRAVALFRSPQWDRQEHHWRLAAAAVVATRSEGESRHAGVVNAAAEVHRGQVDAAPTSHSGECSAEWLRRNRDARARREFGGRKCGVAVATL